MCVFISAEAGHDMRGRLVAAARRASGDVISVEVKPASRWPWPRDLPVVATITLDGGCSCSLLADDADTNAEAWSLEPEFLPALVATLRTLIAEGPPGLRISALWVGERAERVEHVQAEPFLGLVARNRLRTKTIYVVESD